VGECADELGENALNKKERHAELVSAPHRTFTLAWSAPRLRQTLMVKTFLLGCRNKFGMTRGYLLFLIYLCPHIYCV